VKLLHTSDWHVGKQLRGQSRAAEHRAVLGEICELAEQHQADLVVVAGDLFDTATPSPDSQGMVYDTLLRLAQSGAEVAVIAGNHDNAHGLRVLAPLFQRCGVHVTGEVVRPADGGCRSFVARDGTPVNLAVLPFVSKRGIVRAEQLMQRAAFEHALAYSQRVAQLISALCAGFSADAVNLLVAHAFVLGGTTGGGERAAHVVEEYAVQAPAFPATAGYVALGHLHRAQSIAGATAIRYCGSPLQLDFGESDQAKQVNLVDLVPGRPAKVTELILASGRPLRTFTGTLEQLTAVVPEDDAWLRLIVREPQRAGLAASVRQRFGDRVVDVRIDSPHSPATERVQRLGRTPHELLADYLASEQIEDPRLLSLFATLLERDVEVSA
jgi:exonuclease SbcD